MQRMHSTMIDTNQSMLLDRRLGYENYASTVGDDDDGSLVLDDLAPRHRLSVPASGDGCSKATLDETSPKSFREHGSSSNFSKLDTLRARNEKARRQSSLQLEALRQSFRSSSSSLLTPTGSKAISSAAGSDTPQLDDTSLETSQSLTWDFDSSPRSVKSMKRPPKVPAQILLRTCKETALATTTAVGFEVSLLHYYIEQCKRLEEQNDLLCGHIRLLSKHHELMIQRDRIMARREIKNQMKSVTRRRLQMALTLFFLFWLAQMMLSGKCTSVMSNGFIPGKEASSGANTPLVECFAMNALMNTRRTLTRSSWSKEVPSDLALSDQRMDLVQAIRHMIAGVRHRLHI
jgi:hypothetical protein